MADTASRARSILSGEAIPMRQRAQGEAQDTRTTAGLIADLQTRLIASEEARERAEDALAVERQNKLDSLRELLERSITEMKEQQQSFQDRALEAIAAGKSEPIVLPPDNSGAILEALVTLNAKIAALVIPAPAIPQQIEPPSYRVVVSKRDQNGFTKELMLTPK